jgi:hypothetical protein
MSTNKGMVQLINKTFANHFATELNNNPLTFIVGSFHGEENESTSSAVAKDNLAGAVVGKTLSEDAAENVASVTRRFDWKSGQIITPYDPDNTNNSNHYRLVNNNSTYEVWLCLENPEGLISTIRPAGAYGKKLSFDDGYKWIKLYSIVGKMTQFLSANYMPVPSFDDITLAPDNTSLRQAEDTIKYWYNNRGSILRIDIDQSLKDIRWSLDSPEPTIDLRQITASNANIRWNWISDSKNSDQTKRGRQLVGATILDGGSGYTQTSNILNLSTEPTYSPKNLTSDHIVGNNYSSRNEKYGPLIKPVLFSHHLDFQNILNADRLMLLFSIDSSEIAQTTDVTLFDTVTLVQNLQSTGGGTIENAIGKNKVFRMTDKVTMSGNHGLAVGNEIQSATISSGTRSIGGRVASTPTTTTVELTRGDGNLQASDTIWSPSSTLMSQIITSNNNSTGSMTSAEAYLGKSVASGAVTSQSFNYGEGQLGQTSLVLYSDTLSANSSITAADGIRFRCIIGGSEVLPI